MTLDENIANDTPVSHGPDDTYPDTAPYEDAVEALAKAKEELAAVMEVAEHRRVRINSLESDITTIGDMLLDEAEQREWCDEYDSFCRKVNQMVGRDLLMPCSREYSVELTVRLEYRSSSGVHDRMDMNNAVYSALNNYLQWPEHTNDQSIGVSLS